MGEYGATRRIREKLKIVLPMFMLRCLDLPYGERKAAGAMRSRTDLEEAILHRTGHAGPAEGHDVCLRRGGLGPIKWSTGPGADVRAHRGEHDRVLFTSFLMALFLYPLIDLLWKWREVRRASEGPQSTLATA